MLLSRLTVTSKLPHSELQGAYLNVYFSRKLFANSTSTNVKDIREVPVHL